MIEFPNLDQLPQEVKNAIIARLQGSSDDDKYEPMGVIPVDLQQEWTSFTQAMCKAETELKEAQARKAIWWARIEKLFSLYDSNLRYDTDSGTILCMKKKKVTNLPGEK